MIIQQDQDVWEHAFALNINSELQSVRLVGAAVSTSLSLEDDREGELEIRINFKPGAAKTQGQGLTFETDFNFRVIDEANNLTNLVAVDCRFEAVYQLRPGFQPSEVQISAFHGGNVVFNCWTFFREYVQSSVVRMNLPAPTVPLLRLMPKPPNSVSSKELKPATVVGAQPKRASSRKRSK